MSRQDDERRRLIVRAVAGALIEHPKWRDSRIAREMGFDADFVAEIRAFAPSYPTIAGVEPEPKDDVSDK